MVKAVIGIDGGATRTRVVMVSLDGQLLGFGQSGPSNYDAVGIQVTRQNVADAIRQACAAADPRSPDIIAVFLGMAGIISQSDQDIIYEIATSIPAITGASIRVDHDLRIALTGGLVGEPGIVLIVGTGCSCFGVNAQGQTLRVGGWGHLLDDFGSSYYLGLQALNATVRAADERIPPTLLSESVLQRLEIPDVQKIMWRVYHIGLQPTEIAALAPLVTEAAERGDVAAISIIENGVQELANLVYTAAKRLGYCCDGSEHQDSPRVVLTGGLVDSYHYYRESLVASIHEHIPGAQTLPMALPPVFGAALLALNVAGVSTEAGLIEALKKSAAQVTSDPT